MKIEESIMIAMEPKISQRAHRILSSGSGSHCSSFRANAVTTTKGTINNRYHGAPHPAKTCLTQPRIERPSIPAANSAAKVTLRPLHARQNHETPENKFTRIRLRRGVRVRQSPAPTLPSRFPPLHVAADLPAISNLANQTVRVSISGNASRLILRAQQLGIFDVVQAIALNFQDRVSRFYEPEPVFELP